MPRCDTLSNINRSRLEDLTGKKFGRLTVISLCSSVNKERVWDCACDCGGTVKVKTASLKRGNTKSCGCLWKEKMSGNQAGKTHGLSKDKNGKKTRLFRIWTGMKTRCFNKKDKAYSSYGGRGISICSEWLDYKEFHDWSMSNGYGGGLSIERIDNDLPYSPGNCKWIPKPEQAKNRRSTKRYHFNGEEVTIGDMSKISGIKYSVLWARINQLNWPIHKAIGTPVCR